MNFIRGIQGCEKLSEKDLCSKEVVLRIYAGALTTYFNYSVSQLNEIPFSLQANLYCPVNLNASPVFLLKLVNNVLIRANGKQLKPCDVLRPEKGVTLAAINAMDKLHRKQEALRVKAEEVLATKVDQLKVEKNEWEKDIEEIHEKIDTLDRAQKKIGGGNATKDALVQQLEILDAQIGTCEKEKNEKNSGKQQMTLLLEKLKVDQAVEQTNLSCANNLITEKNQMGEVEVSKEELKREIYEAEAEVKGITLQMFKLKEVKGELIKRVDKMNFRECQTRSEAQEKCEKVMKVRTEVLMILDRYKKFEEEFVCINNEFEKHKEVCEFVSSIAIDIVSVD